MLKGVQGQLNEELLASSEEMQRIGLHLEEDRPRGREGAPLDLRLAGALMWQGTGGSLVRMRICLLRRLPRCLEADEFPNGSQG